MGVILIFRGETIVIFKMSIGRVHVGSDMHVWLLAKINMSTPQLCFFKNYFFKVSNYTSNGENAMGKNDILVSRFFFPFMVFLIRPINLVTLCTQGEDVEVPTTVPFKNSTKCGGGKPLTFVTALYNGYGKQAPLRRNPA